MVRKNGDQHMYTHICIMYFSFLSCIATLSVLALYGGDHNSSYVMTRDLMIVCLSIWGAK